jgi:hypothetical protein
MASIMARSKLYPVLSLGINIGSCSDKDQKPITFSIITPNIYSYYLTKAPQISQIIRQIVDKKIQFASNFMKKNLLPPKKFAAPD